MTDDLSDSERLRYARQIEGALGTEGQLRLKASRAIVIGVGAAGAGAAAELASRGVGYVAVVDGGSVGLDDLAGQALYYTPDVGQRKAEVLATKLWLLNPEVQADSYPVALDAQNARAIVAGHDVVLDCTHDPEVAAALAAAGVAPLADADAALRRLARPEVPA